MHYYLLLKNALTPLIAAELTKKISKVRNVFDVISGSISVHIIAKPSNALMTIETIQTVKHTLFNGLI
jgi:hypothetical protein